MEVWLFNHWVTREVRKFLFIMSNDLTAMQLPYRTTCSGGLVAQSCPTLCDPVDCGPSGSSVLGLLQARMPEWVAIPFSGDLPTQGLKPGLPHCRQILYRLSLQGSPRGRGDGYEGEKQGLPVPRYLATCHLRSTSKWTSSILLLLA